MAKHQTSIMGFEVELETYEEDGQPRSTCSVSHKGFSSSLSVLTDYGHLAKDLPGGVEEYLQVPGFLIEAIEEWAIAHGY